MAFDVGAIVARLELDAKQWRQSIAAVKKDQSSFQGLVLRNEQQIKNFGKALTVAGAAVTASFGLLIKKTADVGDYINDLSQRTGIATEILSGYKLAADKSGTSLGGLAIGLRGLANQMQAANAGSKEAQAIFKTLGVSITDSAGKLRPLNDVMLDVAERFSQMPDGAQKTAMAMDVFGRAGMELIPMFNMGKKGLQENYEATKKLGGIWSGEAALAADQFNDSMAQLKTSIGGLGKEITMAFLPTAKGLIDILTGVISKFRDWAAAHPGAIATLGQLTLGFGALATQIGPLLVALPRLIELWKLLKITMSGVLTGGAIGVLGVTAIAGIAETVKNVKLFNQEAELTGKKTPGLIKAIESFNMTLAKIGIGVDRSRAAMKGMVQAELMNTRKGLELAALSTETLAEANVNLGQSFMQVIEPVRAWNEVLGVTTRLEIEKKLRLMEIALTDVKRASQLTWEEQARLRDEIQKAKEALAGWNITAQVTLGLLPKLRDNTDKFITALDQWDSALPNLRAKTADLFITWDEYSGKAASSMKELTDDTLSAGQQVSVTIANMIGSIAGAIGGNLSAAKQRFLSLVQTMILGAVQICIALGTIKAATGDIIGAVVAMGAAIFAALFGGKPKKTYAERMAEELEQMTDGLIRSFAYLGEVSRSTAEAIAKDMQKGMEGYIAVSLHFADVIRDVGVNQENVNELWARAGWLIDELKNGMVDAVKGAESLGESFTAMLEGAKKLGQEGSKAMVDFILKIRAAGLEIAEVTEYVVDQLSKIPAAMNTIVSSIAMPNKSIEEMRAELDLLYQKLSEVKKGSDEWESLNEQIKASEKNLNKWEGRLTGVNRHLNAMAGIATLTFQSLIQNGVTYLDALNQMKGPLQEMFDRYKKFGIAIPDVLKPLMGMMEKMEKFPAIFERLGAAQEILSSLRNTGYLTQQTFNSLAAYVNTAAKTILNIKGSLNSFMDTAKLSRSQIEMLLPLVSQFVGAAAVFGLGVPSWMKTFVTKQLGVDWGTFKEKTAAMANSGISTVEKLKKMLEKGSLYDSRMSVRFHNLIGTIREGLGNVVDAIGSLPHAATGAYFPKPALVHIAENEPEFAIPKRMLSSFAQNKSGSVNSNLQLTFNIHAIDNSDMEKAVKEKIVPIIIKVVDKKVNYKKYNTKLSEALGLS